MMLTSNSARVLDNHQIKRTAPSVFAVSPYSAMSGKYRMVPTIEVVDMLRDKGFSPIRADQSRTRIPGKGDFTRHVLRFRHTDHLTSTVVGTEIPELVLMNSHDGSSAYRFMAGIFRLVCSNGMIVQSSDHGSISVRHQGGTDFHDRVIDATYQIMEDAPKTLAQIDKWKAIDLTAPHREAFATAALELKTPNGVTPTQILSPRRVEDRKTDLWTTTNVVQEHIIRGGDRARTNTGRRTTTRPVKSVTEDIRLNRALWTLTEKLGQIVGV